MTATLDREALLQRIRDLEEAQEQARKEERDRISAWLRGRVRDHEAWPSVDYRRAFLWASACVKLNELDNGAPSHDQG